MKRLSMLFLSSFLVFIYSVSAQDMSPEAGRLYNEGNGMLKAGNYNGAIDNYDAALNIEKDYRIFYQRGVALKKSGDLQNAKSSFEECIKLKSDFAGGYNALGGVFFSLGDYNNAIANFETVLTLNIKANVEKKVKKNLSLAYSKLGNNEISNGNSTRAIEYLSRAVDYYNYDAAYLSLAKLYSELGEWDKSIAASESALKHRSKISKGGPYFYMGVSYKGKGDNEKAKEMFQKAKTDLAYKKTAEYELSLLN